MAKSRYGIHINFVAGTVFGLCLGVILSTWCRNKFIPCAPSFSRSGCCIDNLDLNVNTEAEQADEQISTNEESANNIFIEEADEKGFLFVGVMTAKKYLDSRAVAAYKTWARSINGKVVFFSSEDSESNFDIPFVALKNVDDSYPPQKKSFSMLKYMYDHFIDKYEWFVRADDDIFIKGEKMEAFLRSINNSKPQFIGQAGVGTKEEIGLLSLGSTDNYCMGGTSMVFSKETLRKVGPHLKYCVNNLYTTHEDVEIGRCVRQFVGIPCTWAFEMQKLFYQNFKEYKGSFVDTLHDKEVENAITMHPIKEPAHQYRVNNHFLSAKILDLKQKKLELQREISEMNQVLNEQAPFNKYGQKPSIGGYVPNKSGEVLGWEFFTKSLSSHLHVNPRKGLLGSRKQSVDQVIAQTMEIINKNSRQRGRTIDFKEVLYGYTQTDPVNGASYILDILLTYKKHKGKSMTVPVRRHAYLHQTFSETEFIENPLTTDSSDSSSLQYELSAVYPQLNSGGTENYIKKIQEPVHFILPLAGKVKEFDRFMKLFEEVCLSKKDNSHMHVVLFTKDISTEEVEQTLSIIGQYQKKYGGHLMEVIEADGDFARAKALDLGAKQCSANDLLYFVDVDIIFTQDALLRIRLNTIQGIQVYYPIVFSQYDPQIICGNLSRSYCKVDQFDFNPKMGYWRQFGYGIAAMYKSDLEKVGGYDISIQGWGKEDVDLFEKIVTSSLSIFRAVDKGMIHAFHRIKCDTNLVVAQFNMCVGSKAVSLGSQRQLAEMVLGMKNVLNRNMDTNV